MLQSAARSRRVRVSRRKWEKGVEVMGFWRVEGGVVWGEGKVFCENVCTLVPKLRFGHPIPCTLVPKLCLGTRLGGKLCFSRRGCLRDGATLRVRPRTLHPRETEFLPKGCSQTEFGNERQKDCEIYCKKCLTTAIWGSSSGCL